MSFESVIDTLEIRNANKISFVGTSSSFVDTTTGRIQTKGIQHNSNVITDVSGPHGRVAPTLKKYPEIAFESGKFDSNDSTNTYVQAGYTVSASDQNIGSSRYVWKLFDNLDGSDWGTSGGSFDSGQPGVASSTGDEIILADTTTHTRGHWAKIKFPNKIIISTYTLNSTSTDRRPASISILGSNDDTEWYIIKDVHAVGSQDEYSISVNATTAYKYIMFMVHSIIGSDNQMKIGDLKFYGYEEDPPTGDHSVDTTFKSRFNNPQLTGVQVLVDGNAGQLGANQISGGADPSGNQATYVTDGKYWTLNGTLTSNLSVEANTFLEGDQPHAVSVWFNSSNLEANVSNTCVFSVSDQEKLDSVNLDLQSNTWHNLTYAYQGEGGSRVAYLDGRKVAEDQAEDTFGEYPPFAMTGYSQGGYVVSATAESNDGTYNSYEAFDGYLNDISAWMPNYPTGGDFDINGDATTQTQFNPGGGAVLVDGPALIIQFPHKVRVTSYNVYARTASNVSYLYANKPKSGRIYGSNDGSTWTHVDTFGDWTTWVANTPQTEVITTPGAYNRYAMVVESMIYQSQTWVAIGEWELYGHHENDLVRLPDPTNVLKYPHIAMTGPGQRGYRVSVSSVYAPRNQREGWMAFNDSLSVPGGHWQNNESTVKYGAGTGVPTNDCAVFPPGGTTKGEWIKLELPFKLKVSSIFIVTASAHEAVEKAILYGSNDDSNWDVVKPEFTTTLSTFGTKRSTTESVTTSNYYKYLVLQVTKADATGGGNNGRAIQIYRLNYYGTEEATPVPIQIGGGNIDKVANFRVYDKFIGEDQVNEIWNAQKEEFGRAKPQMVLQQGKLGIGTDAPQGSLSVADEPDPTTYGLQEFPPKPLHANETHIEGHGIFRASASRETSTSVQAWEAFDEVIDVSSGWDSLKGTDQYRESDGDYIGSDITTTIDGGQISGTFIQLEMPYKVKLQSISIMPQKMASGDPNFYGGARMPKTGSIVGSNDGVNWYLIASIGQLVYFDGILTPFQTASTTFYSYFRLIAQTITQGANSIWRNRFNLSEFKLFGTREQVTKQSVLHDGQLTLTKNLTVPSIGPSVTNTRHAVPKRHKLVVEFDTSTNPTGLTTVRDTSGSGNHGTLFGDASYSAADKAFKFDGTNDVLHVASGTGLPTGDAIYTLSCWIKTDPNQSTTNPSVFYFGSAWTSNQLAGIYLRDGNKVAHDIGSTNSYTTNATITPNKWHHVAVVKRGTGTIVATTTYQGIFVDGVEITELSRNGSDRQQALSTIDNISIGHHFSGTVGSGGAVGVVGFISKPQIWNVALTAGDVKTLYDMGRGDSYHVTNFKNTLVGINLGNGQAPRSALDVRDKIYAESSSVQTFTGQHICFPDESMEKGLIVSAKKNQFVKLNGLAIGKSAITIDESLPIVSLSNVAQDKACFGVVSKMEESNAAYRTEITGGLVSESIKIAGDNRAVVNSVGEGAIWVVDTGGPLESGDYITTSNVAGYGQKQDDDVLHNFTVAKITMDCDFTGSNVAVQTIKREQTGTQIITEDAWNQLVEYDRYSNVEDEITTYYQVQRGGNVLDENGQLQFEDKTGATEEPYERRFLTTDGTQTDEANAAHIAAFVGCTYHCG